ncbi:DUF590 family protein [Pelomyxa schiedti]|nr:DUF590 family protein [Pelomyxa schiedti]
MSHDGVPIDYGVGMTPTVGGAINTQGEKKHKKKEKKRKKREIVSSPSGWPVDERKTRHIIAETVLGFESGLVGPLQVPEGYRVKYTKTGHPYLKKIKNPETTLAIQAIKVSDATTGEAFSEEPIEEDQIKPPGVCSSSATLGSYYGIGVQLYFHFLNFVILTNVFLFLLAAINFVPHFFIDFSIGNSDDDALSIVQEQRKLFYLSSYSQPVFSYWITTVSVVIISAFFLGPLYSKTVSGFFNKRQLFDHEDNWDVEDTIPENAAISKCSHIARMCLCYSIFILLLLLLAIFTFGFAILEMNFVSSKVASACIAFVICIIRMVWGVLGTYLTKFERHKTWISFENHALLKWYLFKLMSLASVYLCRWLVAVRYAEQFTFNWDIPDIPWFEDSSSGNFTSSTSRPNSEELEKICGLVSIGDQFVMLLAIDLIVSNFMEIILPIVWPIIKKIFTCSCCKKDKQLSPKSKRPEFEVAEEYLELLYRQFVIYLGFPFVPMISAMGLIINLFELLVDRFRLVKICKKPPVLHGSMKKQLVFYLFLTAGATAACFPNGGGWIIAGFHYSNVCPPFWPWTL